MKKIYLIISTEGIQVHTDEPVFYYHSDHLGSASYITDDVGDPTQHLVYLPFGEDWVDMKYNTSQFDTPYKFNGKEKDPETGLNYYGARYLNTDLSIWLSVDPMSDKYPHLTSYNYCANNPVMLVDPDGREIVNAQGKSMYTNGKWTKHATEDAKRIGTSMVQTKTGREQFNMLVKSKAKIKMEISKETKIEKLDDGKSTIYTFGQMQDAKGIVENGKYTLSSAKIVIYEGTINQYAEDVISTGQFSSNEIMNSTINNNQIIGAVAAHESVHTTSENLKIQKEGGDAEKGPNEIESQVLKETKELNKKNNE